MKKRDIGAELLEAIDEISAGGGAKKIVCAPDEIKNVRNKLNASQAIMAKILGVSVRTLQSWEQGKRSPSGAAASLLTLASKNPRAVQEALF